MDKLDLVVKKIDDLKKDVEKDIDDTKDTTSFLRHVLLELSNDVRRIKDDLNYHIKRTDLNEKQIQLIEERLSVSYLLKLAAAAVAGIGSIAGTVYAVVKLIDLFVN